MASIAETSVPHLANPTLRLKNMATGERPQERLEKHGSAVLSDTELLAMLLRKGSKNFDVLALASHLIAEAGSLTGLLNWTDQDFMQLKGIGRIKALQLISVIEIAKRILIQKEKISLDFSTPKSVYTHFQSRTVGLEVEKVWVLCLNRKNRLIKSTEIASGTVSSSLIHPREIYREAIRLSASAIICVHNHPSGDPSPSQDDYIATQLLEQASKTIKIQLLDHIIVGQSTSDPNGKGFYSFAKAGLLGRPPANKKAHIASVDNSLAG